MSWDFGDFPDLRGAVCASADPELFFMDGQRGSYWDARSLCNGDAEREPCPVREACLTWALEHNELGFWGGTTETDRDRIKRRRKESAA